jgi:two-component system, NarL family, sensor histidine kinase DevS
MHVGSKVYLALLLIAGVACAVSMSGLLQAQWPDWRWHQTPLHSTMEAIGGIASIAMAIVLLQRREGPAGSKFQFLASGFLGMGILEVFHAMAQPGNSFVLLRNVASFAGGVGFGLVCIKRPEPSPSRGTGLPWGVAAAASMFGAWALAFPDHIPEMIRNGRFTPTAVAPQSLACLFFLAATARFLLDYRQSKRPEDFLFASLALMFGVAELVFMYSVPWDLRWWFWHALRLTAYLLVLWEVSRGYLRTISDLKNSLEQTTRVEGTLRQSEQHLRRSLDDRERMAQDLHDGIIQSIFAVTLNLERCQRLIGVPAKEVIGQLGAAIADLKLVIRDLRGYLVGLEPPIADGRELETAFATLVKSMASPVQLPFRLEVDPLAADRVTPEQASHLLSVAREALSNSLRHSAAKTGTVSLQFEEDHVRLIVEDDGVGFHRPAVEKQGHGLRNMAARARRLNGRLDVVTEPGQGTRVIFDLPQEASHASA